MNLFKDKKELRGRSVGRRSLPLGLLSVSLGAVFVGCKPDQPDGVIPESKMEQILYDYHVAQAMAEARPDSVGFYRYLYIRSVFDKYGITEADFDSSMVWYSANASYLADMYTRINERYAAELEALGSHLNKTDFYNSLTATGDTANVWHGTDFCMLRPGGIDNTYTFTMEADTSFYPGDDVLWQFNNFYVYQEGGREAYAALIVRYDNDSIASVYQNLSISSTADLSIRTPGKERIRSLTGFIYLPNTDEKQNKTFRMMLVNSFKLVRFHKKDDQEQRDSLVQTKDSLRQDSDSLAHDSLRTRPVRGSQERMSPQQFRDNQPVERKIRVVKEKPYSVRSVRRRNVR